MNTLKLARNFLILIFVLMFLGLSLPLPVMVILIAGTGIICIKKDENVISFLSVPGARKLRMAHTRRNLTGLVALVVLPLILTLTIAPSLSSEDQLPNVTALKAFSSQTKFMSREGFLKYIARRDFGMILSRSQARKIIKKQKRTGMGTHYVAVNSERQFAINPERQLRFVNRNYKTTRVVSSNKSFDRSQIHVRSRFSKRKKFQKTSKTSRIVSVHSVFAEPVYQNRKLSSTRYSENVYHSNNAVLTENQKRSYVKPVRIERISRNIEKYYPVRETSSNGYEVTKEIETPVYSQNSRLSKPAYLPVLNKYNGTSFRYSRNRVAVLPFSNVDVHKNPAGRVENEIIKSLHEKGYEVVSIPHDLYNQVSNGSLTKNEMRNVAERLGVEYVVAGNVLRYHPYKKMRLAGLIVGGLLTGVHGYGDVKLEGHVYSLSANTLIKKNVAERTKKQMLGIIAGTNDLLGLSLNRAVSKMLGFM